MSLKNKLILFKHQITLVYVKLDLAKYIDVDTYDRCGDLDSPNGSNETAFISASKCWSRIINYICLSKTHVAVTI